MALPGGCMRGAIQKQANTLVQTVADVGPSDRRTTAQYAKEHGLSKEFVDKATAATGKIVCGDSTATANLVMSTNEIVTTNHTFLNRETCKKYSEPEACTFYLTGQKEGIKIKHLVDSGIHDCQLNGGGDNKSYNDWAVLKLEQRVEGVEPYSVSMNPNAEIVSGKKVISVENQSFDFGYTDKKTKTRILPKSVGDCAIHDAFQYPGWGLYQFGSDCDFSMGGSGGAILAGGLNHPILLGISTHAPDSYEEEKRAVRRGTRNGGSYDADKWATLHVPVTNKFLSAIMVGAD